MGRPIAVAAMVTCSVLLAGCGSGGDGTTGESASGETTGAEQSKPSQSSKPRTHNQAEAYALEVTEEMTGKRKRSGCLGATKTEGGEYADSGQVAEEDPGCVFSATLGGCLEGIEGRQIGPVSYREEFPEPGLQEIYLRAKRHCEA